WKLPRDRTTVPTLAHPGDGRLAGILACARFSRRPRRRVSPGGAAELQPTPPAGLPTGRARRHHRPGRDLRLVDRDRDRDRRRAGEPGPARPLAFGPGPVAGV